MAGILQCFTDEVLEDKSDYLTWIECFSKAPHISSEFPTEDVICDVVYELTEKCGCSIEELFAEMMKKCCLPLILNLRKIT